MPLHSPCLFACLNQKMSRQNPAVGPPAVSIRGTLQCNRILPSAPKFIVLFKSVFDGAAARQQISCHERFTPCYETRYPLTCRRRQFCKNSYLATFHYKIEIAVSD